MAELKEVNPAKGEPSQPLRELFASGIRRGWRFFCAVRVALILILLLTLLTVVGTLVMQVPAEVKANPADYRWWLNNPAQERFGFWARPLALLGLFDIFHSFWFLGAGFLLVVNIMICTLNRWPSIRRTLSPQRVSHPDTFYQGGPNRVAFAGLSHQPDQVASTVSRVLRRRHYRVQVENNPAAFYFAAAKNRYFRLATFLSHFSIILFLIAFLIGSLFGFRIRSLMVPVGSVREVGYGTNLSLQVNSFVDEYWPEGPPKDFRSEVVLYESGQEVRRGTIRVNHPLSYKGVRFYQAFFGQAVELEVRDPQERVIFNDALALGWVSGKKPFQRPLGFFNLPDSDLVVYVLAPAQGYFDPLIKAGQVRVELYPPDEQGGPLAIRNLDQGQPVALQGYTFTFVREKQFSGFQASKDPGNALIWISSGLFTLGISLVFYFPHRQVWGRCRRDEQGNTELILRTISSRSFPLVQEMESLREELGQELGPEKG